MDYKLTDYQTRRRNYDLKVIHTLKERLRNDKDFLELTFIERAIILFSLRLLKKYFYDNDFKKINKWLSKECKFLSIDMVSKIHGDIKDE